MFNISRKRESAAPSGFHTVSRSQKKQIPFFVFWPATILYMELVLRMFFFTNSFFKIGLIYTALFSVAIGTVLTVICSIWSRRTNRIVTLCLLYFIFFIFGFHGVSRNMFPNFFTLQILENTGNAINDFSRQVFEAVFKSIIIIILLAIPCVGFTIFGKKYVPTKRTGWDFKIIAMLSAIVAHLLCYFLISINAGSPRPDSYYYNGSPLSSLTMNDTVSRFGILTSTRIDIQQSLFGAPEMTAEHPVNNNPLDKEPVVPDIIYDDNVMDIDFNALIENAPNDSIKDMHQYFSSVEPTKQNEYTGYFKGKNLIYLTLEGFCPQFITPELTPTLYKMSTEGFVFENYYNSLWGGSTATGEYSNVTGNFYNEANCLRKSASTSQPFALGNQMKKLGYKTYAYHNNTYTYYSRDKSHPNLGYSFKAIGNGLTGLKSCWPRSDLEMAQSSINVDDWISEEPFHVYYMTVSGHCNYTWNGNQMSTKHKDITKDLDYSENIKAYIACNYEVELMLTELVNQLEAKGILDDTVFVMTTDHYPYALSDGELAELYGLPQSNIRDNFDLYRNGLIIWSSSMEEPIKVTKPCSSIDILPTVSNLFGLQYDSRLITGRDILSDSEGLVILNCLTSGSWNWITDVGSYCSWTNKFTINSEYNGDFSDSQIEEYVEYINKVVNAKHVYSLKILDKNYYKYVF